MNLDKEAKEYIALNSQVLYSLMTDNHHYSFNELQCISSFTDTDLCLAIVKLLQMGKIKQGRDEKGVYYMV